MTEPIPDDLRPARAPGSLDGLVEVARGYARDAVAANTRRAYAADWAGFERWTRRRGLAEITPDAALVALYLADCASGAGGERPVSVATIERRLAGIRRVLRLQGRPLDGRDRALAEVIAGIRRRHARPPRVKAALAPDEILAMADALPRDLRGLRDRAILLLGYAGGLRRSEIVGLDLDRDAGGGGGGWIEILDRGALLRVRGKTGWREVAVGRGSGPRSCPVHALERWLEFAAFLSGPLFRRVSRDGRRALPDRLSDRHVARLVKRAALAAGLRPDLPEAERLALFSGHSLRAGLASHAGIEERHVQRHLGHASAEMTRRYQRRRDRFAVNLTTAAGL